MGIAEEIIAIGHKKRYLSLRGESIGLLVRGATKENVKRGDYITNCPRMKKAIELCGGKVFHTGMVCGIERFCWCLA